MKKKIVFSIFIALVVGVACSVVEAVELKSYVEEYSEEYKQWLELPEEERVNVVAPRMYDIPKEQDRSVMFKNNNITKFNLQDYIPENTTVRDQMQTNSCWAFSTLGALESTIALDNYYNNASVKKYDFSERHLEYATSRVFKNKEINTMRI